MLILGISAFYHDSAISLIENGEIKFSVQEERFSRIKHDSSFPFQSIKKCLEYCDLNLNQIDYFCFYEKPYLKLDRLINTYFTFSPKGSSSFYEAAKSWIKNKFHQKRIIIQNLERLGLKKDIKERLLFSEHHLSHAASAFFPSPFKTSVILTMDGVGEYATSSLGIGDENTLFIDKEIHFPHSLGLLYSAFTYHCGFKVNSGEYKLMGLAPYGEPIYKKRILDNLIDVKEDGSFMLNMEYFDYCTGFKMINEKFCTLFDIKKRHESNKILNKNMNLASSIQSVTEDIVLKITKEAFKNYSISKLCLAGGVALNCVANGKIVKERIFKNIWVQPAAGDAGGALGSALFTYYHILKHEKRRVKKNDSMKCCYLGHSFSNREIENRLIKIGASFIQLSKNKLIQSVVQALLKQKVVGWFQGRMEYGPRALGNRSIIADPRSNQMQKKINLKIKFRESFRPFAPIILEEKTSEWFDLNLKSKHMSLVANVKKEKLRKINKLDASKKGLKKLQINKSIIPAVTHVDNTARIQTVSKKDNPLMHNLINEFYKKTKCPLLVNTSFNVRGEPIVNDINDAFFCFMETNMDLLVIGNFMLIKERQDKNLKKNYFENIIKD